MRKLQAVTAEVCKDVQYHSYLLKQFRVQKLAEALSVALIFIQER